MKAWGCSMYKSSPLHSAAQLATCSWSVWSHRHLPATLLFAHPLALCISRDSGCLQTGTLSSCQVLRRSPAHPGQMLKVRYQKEKPFLKVFHKWEGTLGTWLLSAPLWLPLSTFTGFLEKGWYQIFMVMVIKLNNPGIMISQWSSFLCSLWNYSHSLEIIFFSKLIFSKRRKFQKILQFGNY